MAPMRAHPFHDLDEEERAFLQARVALFGFVAGGLMVIGYLLRVGILLAYEGHDITHPSSVFHALIGVPLLSAWLLCRRGPRRLGVVIAIQAFALLGAAVCLMIMGAYIPIVARPDLIITFALALIMMARAIFVPTPWQVTAAQGVVLGIGLVGTSYWYYASLDAADLAHLPAVGGETAADYAWLNAVVAGVWWSITALLAVGATRVIYGLRQEVADVRRLGQYTLERKLGEGGMGIVYEASHAMLRRPTAVKLLMPDKTSERSIKRFEREVQHTARLTHPNTITVFDYGRTPDGLFYYAMELVDGATLADLIEVSGYQDPSRVVHVLAAAAGALSEAHGVGLTHRDIKPANIMLCDRGGVPDTVKVLDFGLVKDVAPDEPGVSLTNVAEVKGTPLYMSPESITDPNAVDPRSDIYALGAVGYFLLTGTHVFDGRTVVEVCSHHLHTPPEAPSLRRGEAVPEALERLVLSCLAKDPGGRPQSAVELRASLLSCGVAAWTDELARAWWRDYGEAVHTVKREAQGSSTAHTIGIDLAQRRRARSRSLVTT